MPSKKLLSLAAARTQMDGATGCMPLWQLDVVELTGHNLEARGREQVNRLLTAGWHLLHIYTLKYREDGVWRERPMAILGRLRNDQQPDRALKRKELSVMRLRNL